MIKDKFVANWQLVEMYSIDENSNKIHPYGETKGLLTYTNDNIMSAQIGKIKRNLFEDNDYRKGQKDEIEIAFNGFISYFGTYSINEKQSYILHNVQMSLFPNWIGQKVKRIYEFQDNYNILILKAPQLIYDGVERTPTLVWSRI